MDFYSPTHLLGDGWIRLNNASGSLLTLNTFYKAPHQYMTFTVVGCDDVASKDVLSPSSANAYCINVWISDANADAPTPFIPKPQSTPSSNLPNAPTYSNPLPVPFFSQRDQTWKNDILGWPSNNCTGCTIGTFGCWTTSYAMVYNYYQPHFTNPPTLNTNLNTGPGGGLKYTISGAGNPPGCNNLMWHNPPYAPPGVSLHSGDPLYNACTSANCIDSDKIALLDAELNAGRPILLNVHYSGIVPQHMVVLTGHSGNTWYVNDPWATDTQQRTLATGALGAYVVDYIFRWDGTPPTGGRSCPGPSLNSPADGQALPSRTVRLHWQALSGCTFNGYTFRVKNTSNMDSGGTTIKDTGEGGTSRTESLGSEWDNQDLYWGVRAANAPNGVSWSVRRFRVQPITLRGLQCYRVQQMVRPSTKVRV